ncbi:helix-turn-helix domain-containing protein [Nonomuraea rubra]
MASDTMTAKPEALRAAMKAAGVDGTMLAARVGVTKQFISLLARGMRRCHADVAARIAEETHSSVDALFVNPSVSENSDNTEEEEVSPISAVLPDDPYLLFDEAAAYTRIKPKTLRHLRAAGEGPPFFRRGQRLMIRRSRLQEWFENTFENAES